MTPSERNDIVLSERNVNDFLTAHDCDRHSCHLWMVNEIIVSLWDYERREPSVDKVKNNWRFDYGQLSDVTDVEISDIIRKVKRYYN